MASRTLLLAAAACDTTVSNPGPVQDEFLADRNASAAMVNVNSPFFFAAFAMTPLPETQALTGQRENVPPRVTGAVVPCRPPVGTR